MTKLLSLIIASAYLAAPYFFANPEILFKMMYFLIIGIACIWFGGPLGRLTRFRWIGNINISQETPGSVIELLGWVVLLLVQPILLVFQK